MAIWRHEPCILYRKVAGKGICCSSGLPGHTRGCCRKKRNRVLFVRTFTISLSILSPKRALPTTLWEPLKKAKFIGHGIGLEINEMPVLAPRMKQELEPGMVFALEPKIVLPGIGPVGIENSWVVTAEGVEKLTLCKEEIVEL